VKVLVAGCLTLLEDTQVVFYTRISFCKLCILIVIFMYSYCHMFCKVYLFSLPSWHSSATLIEVFPCFFLSYKANVSVNSQRRGTARNLPKLIVLFYVFFCVNVYCTAPPGVSSITVNKYIKSSTYTSKFKTKVPQDFFTLSFHSCPKTTPIRRSMIWISTRKPKSKRRKTCLEIQVFWGRLYRLY